MKRVLIERGESTVMREKKIDMRGLLIQTLSGQAEAKFELLL